MNKTIRNTIKTMLLVLLTYLTLVFYMGGMSKFLDAINLDIVFLDSGSIWVTPINLILLFVFLFLVLLPIVGAAVIGKKIYSWGEEC